MLVLLSCVEVKKIEKGTDEGNQVELEGVEEISKVGAPKNEERPTLVFSETVSLFIEKVLGENQRKYRIDTASTEIRHIGFFSRDELVEVIAFFDKRNPQEAEPTYYENFLLFSLRYTRAESAKNAYESIKKTFELSREEIEKLSEEERKEVRRIQSSAKYGGMIVQQGEYVFSLVETCRNTPVGGKWEEYEDLFLSFITEKGEEIGVLNANCGDMKYREEKRRIIL